MQNNPRSFNVTQKLNSQTDALGGTFNQSRQIGHYEVATVVQTNHSKIWNKRGKMIVGDFRLGTRYDGKKRRFANGRKSDQADICQDLEFKLYRAFNSRLAVFGNFGSRIFGRSKMNVAATAATAFRNNQFLTCIYQVSQDFSGFSIRDRRALRNVDIKVFCSATVHSLDHPVLPWFCFKNSMKSEIHQSSQAFVHLQNDASALAAVTTGRTSVRNIFFTPESNSSIPAFSGLYLYFHLIYKHFFHPYLIECILVKH